MKFCQKTTRHNFLIDIILLLSLIVAFTGIVVQIWFMQFDVNTQGLQAKRYLVKPLLKVLGDDDKDSTSWIRMVVMEEGLLTYPHNGFDAFFENILTSSDGDYLTKFMSVMVESIPNDMSIVSFIYNGKKGLCFFFDDDLPYVIKIIKTPKTLLRIFIAMIIFLSLGGYLANRLKKNLKELGLAINRMRDLDFDTPINILHKNDLGDILNAFDDMRKEMKSNRSKGVLLITSITHDLKTPLTSIRGYLEAIKDGMIDTVEDLNSTVDKMLKKTSLLDERINEILEFSKTMNSSNLPKDESFLIKPWLNYMKEYLNEESRLYSINFSVKDLYSGDYRIAGDSKKITRSVINLYDNACRYIGKGDPIRFLISMNSKNTMLVLTMDDGGKGVLPEDREKIFDLFFRKDKGRNTRGMGIGLASVKFVAEFHGGKVQCLESELGGASFKITLPVLS